MLAHQVVLWVNVHMKIVLWLGNFPLFRGRQINQVQGEEVKSFSCSWSRIYKGSNTNYRSIPDTSGSVILNKKWQIKQWIISAKEIGDINNGPNLGWSKTESSREAVMLLWFPGQCQHLHSTHSMGDALPGCFAILPQPQYVPCSGRCRNMGSRARRATLRSSPTSAICRRFLLCPLTHSKATSPKGAQFSSFRPCTPFLLVSEQKKRMDVEEIFHLFNKEAEQTWLFRATLKDQVPYILSF